MEQINNSVLVQCATLSDIEKIVNRAIDKRMEIFYKSIQKKTPMLVRRKDAAKFLEISLPTLDKYARYGIVRPKHIGGRVYFSEEDLLSIQSRRPGKEHFAISKQ